MLMKETHVLLAECPVPAPMLSQQVLDFIAETSRATFARGVHAAATLIETNLNHGVSVRTGLGDVSTDYTFRSLAALKRDPRRAGVEGFFSTRAALLAVRTAEEALLTAEELAKLCK